MSLVCWLPLNGNLDNQGLSNITITNNGATVNNSGKIGKCYSFDGTDDYISLTSTSLYNTIKGGNVPFSIAMWVYRADATRAVLFGDYGLPGEIKFNLELTTSHAVRFYWSASPDLVLSSAVLTQSAWNHLSITYDGTCVKCYINGELNQSSDIVLNSMTKSSGAYYLGRDNRTGTTALNGKINDFRIYDHCLSPLEIKQISQGLMCHYKLSCVGNGNLIKGCYECYSTNSTRTTTGSLTFTLSSDEMLELKGKTLVFSYYYSAEGERLNADGGLGNRFGIHGSFNYTNTDGTKKQSYPFANYLTTSGTGRAVMTWTVPTDIDTINSNLSFSIQTNYAKPTSDNENTWYIKGCKLEIGSNATSWCPNKNDTLYSTLGYDDNIEYDCSGYGNNGIIQGNITWSSNTPRYSGSYGFDGTNYIKTNYSASMSELSCSFWVKPSSQNGGYSIIASNYNNPPSGFWIAVNCENSGLWFYNGAYVKGNSLLSNDVWYHGVFTYNKGIGKWYLNGELVTTADISSKGTSLTISSLSIGNSYTGTAWNTKFYGSISDFRIYATCLSDEDVKYLYQVSASVDKTGILSCYEFSDDSNNEITKNGIISFSELYESDDISSVGIGKSLIQANDFIEL